MSKPEPPQKIESLPTGKKAASKKTGWEPPSPQKVRKSERSMGVLLAFCLLGAIGFVAYRKFDEKRGQPADADQLLVQNADTGERPPETDPTTAGESPPAEFGFPGQASDDVERTTAVTFDPPTDLMTADTQLVHGQPVEQPSPENEALEFLLGAQTEPDAQPDDGQSEPASGGDPFAGPFTIAETETQPQRQPEAIEDTGNPFGGPFTVAETEADPPPQADPIEAGGDPFSGFAAAEPALSTPDEEASFSSDSDSPSGAPLELGAPGLEAEIATNDVPSGNVPPADDNALAEMPVMNLFGGDDPIPAENGEPAQPAEPVGNPWFEPADDAAVAQSDPPRMLEPNDPHVMPAISVNPFAAADNESAPSEAPVETNSDEPFNPFPAATAVTNVAEAPAAAPPGRTGFEALSSDGDGESNVDRNPFGSEQPVARRERGQIAHQPQHDPFAPARDVSHAISEDEVVIHVVQSGDNFWKISSSHYGTGKLYTALAAYNQSRIPDPRRMRPGMKVLVPSRATLAQQFPQLVAGNAHTPYVATPGGPTGFSIDASGRPQYRVAKGDTLSRIAERHLGRSSRWRQIYGMNRDQLPDANSLKTGMVLRLPADATQVRMDTTDFRRR